MLSKYIKNKIYTTDQKKQQ